VAPRTPPGTPPKTRPQARPRALAREIVGVSLRKAREDKGLTIYDVGDALGVGASAVSRWETGSRWPGADDLLDFCELVGLDTGDLFLGLPSPGLPSPPA
jgi:transcriptional regulator with XRE-family HTH domain